MDRRSQRRRFALACLTLAVFVAGIFARGVHGVLEPHQYCATHGAFEHGASGTNGATGADGALDATCDASEVVDRGAATSLEPAASEGPEVEHVPCTLSTLTRDENLALFDAPTSCVCAPPARVVRAPRATPRASAVALYRLAPKGSPPVA